MKYLKTKLATDWDEEKSLSKKMLVFVPKANPGYENKMHLVKEWVVEFDENNIPFREIALDAKGYPVFAGPSKENYGFWLDAGMQHSDFTGIEIESSEFERLWSKSGVNVVA